MNPNNHTTKKKPAAGKKRAGRLTQQMLRIMHTSLDRIELVLATIPPEPKPLPDDRDPLQRAVGRWTNSLLALWQQCDKPGCRRARRCCGLPTACLLARAPHVPPEALAGVKTMLNGRRSLDDLDLNAAARNEVGTVKAWLGPDFPLHDRRHNLPCIAKKGKLPVQAGASPAKGGDMKTITANLGAAAIALLAQTEAQATTLSVVTVNVPAVNCVFDASCEVVVSDQVGNLTYTPLGAGAQLQSRSFAAKPGTPGAGKTAYLYRVDLTQGAGFTECLAGLVINFGPVAKLPYAGNNQSDVFVVTQGGLGTVGIKSAEQDGDVITFNFGTYLCAGQTSFFFGLAAAKAPMASTATLFGIGRPPFVQTAVRVPTH